MPNHVYNTITPKTKMSNEILDKLSKGICKTIRPRPESEDENWYYWNLNNWDTKWGDYELYLNKNIITFVSAWSPVNGDIIEELYSIIGSFDYKWEEEQGYGAEYSCDEYGLSLLNEWDMPDFDIIETDDEELYYLKTPYKDLRVGVYDIYPTDEDAIYLREEI